MKKLLLAAAVAALAVPAFAQDDYPNQPITFVVPFAAGGPTDTVTRLIAESMSATLGQQVVVENVDRRRRHGRRGAGRGAPSPTATRS